MRRFVTVHCPSVSPFHPSQHTTHSTRRPHVDTSLQLVNGSTRVFASFLDRCLRLDRVPICRLIPRANAPAEFVALLPQEEQVDDEGHQVVPPGFHIITLPFAEDMRTLKKPKPEEPTEVVLCVCVCAVCCVFCVYVGMHPSWHAHHNNRTIAHCTALCWSFPFPGASGGNEEAHQVNELHGIFVGEV